MTNEQLLTYYRDDELSTYEIGRTFGISNSTVRRRLIKLGVFIRDRSQALRVRWSKNSKRPTKATLHKLYIDQQLSGNHIARLYGVDPKTVRRWLQRYSIPRRTVEEGVRLYYGKTNVG